MKELNEAFQVKILNYNKSGAITTVEVPSPIHTMHSSENRETRSVIMLFQMNCVCIYWTASPRGSHQIFLLSNE